MKVRFLSVILCLVFASTMFANGQQESSISDQKVIEWWHIRTSWEEELIKAVVAEYESLNPNVKVNLTSIEAAQNQSVVNVAFGGGTPPDIFRSQGGGALQPYIDADQVFAINDMIESNPEFGDSYPSTVFEPVSYEGNIYGIPESGSAVSVMWINKSEFEKLNIKLPETYNELLTAIKTFQDNGISNPIALANKEKWPVTQLFEVLILRTGGPNVLVDAIYKRNGVTFSDPAIIEAAYKLQELVKVGGISSAANSNSFGLGGARRDFYAGNAVMEVMGNWEYANMLNENEEWTNENISFIPFPYFEDRPEYANVVKGMPAGDYCIISEQSEVKDEAFELLTLLSSMKYQKRAAEHGRLIAVVGGSEYIQNPVNKELQSLITSSDAIQRWGDKMMSPKLADMHKNLLQNLISLSITPEEYAQGMDKANN